MATRYRLGIPSRWISEAKDRPNLEIYVRYRLYIVKWRHNLTVHSDLHHLVKTCRHRFNPSVCLITLEN